MKGRPEAGLCCRGCASIFCHEACGDCAVEWPPRKRLRRQLLREFLPRSRCAPLFCGNISLPAALRVAFRPLSLIGTTCLHGKNDRDRTNDYLAIPNNCIRHTRRIHGRCRRRKSNLCLR
ncbi:protein of unknown function (plasmid) [Agreia sp. COWG]|nr:protein of unknown function [Agreia sp. COWG]